MDAAATLQPLFELLGSAITPSLFMGEGAHAHIPMLQVVLVCSLYIAEVPLHMVQQADDCYS